MKLSELGLKTKPATHYFEFGWVSFSTDNKELYYEVVAMTKGRKTTLDGGLVLNKEHLEQLLAIKSLKECTTWL